MILAASCSSEPTRIPLPAPVSKPYGWLDRPTGTVQGKTRVFGWALSDQGAISRIEILLDSKSVAADLHRVFRGGLCATYPGRADCPNAGFQGQVDFALVPKGAHRLALRLTSTSGAVAEIAERTVAVE